MRSPFAALRSLTLPFGQTSGTRIVIDGVNGTITIFDAANNIRLQMSSQFTTPSSIELGTDDAAETINGRIAEVISGAGGGRNDVMLLQSGSLAGDVAEIQLRSESQDGTTDPAEIRFGASNNLSPIRLGMSDGSASQPLGRATLVAGVVVVNHAFVTAASRIFVSRATPGGALGHLDTGTRTPGTSFTITSSSATETSTVDWLMVEPV